MTHIGWQDEILKPILAGFLGGASFGPINLTVLYLHSASKRIEALVFSTGALLGDLLIVATQGIVLTVIHLFIPSAAISILGGAALVAIGVFGLRKISAKKNTALPFENRSILVWMLIALVVTYLSPFGFVVWGALVSSTAPMGFASQQLWFVFIGNLLWFFSYNTILFRYGKVLSETTRSKIGSVSALAIILLGITSVVVQLRGE